MIFFACDSRSKSSVEILKRNRWGRLFCANASKPYEGETWAFDNGAYRAWIKKEKWNQYDYLKRLDKQRKYGTPYFAVVPDIVASPDSLEFSLKWRERLPNDWKWYLAIQDHTDFEVFNKEVHKFDGVFLGGSDVFKVTAQYWANLTKFHKKKFHYGRVSTRKRIQHARRIGADSIDSAFPFWIESRRKVVENALTEPIEKTLFWI